MFESLPDVIDISQICCMLHISRHTAYALVKSGQIPARRIGRIYRISKKDVITFMTSTDK